MRFSVNWKDHKSKLIWILFTPNKRTIVPTVINIDGAMMYDAIL